MKDQVKARMAGASGLLAEPARLQRTLFPIVFGILAAISAARGDYAAAVALVGLGALASPRSLGETASYAYGLPGLADGPPAPNRVSRKICLQVSVGALTIALVLTVVRAPWWAFFALFFVAGLVWLVAAEGVFRFWVHSRRLTRALTAYSPTIGMAFAGRSGGPWQLRMWEPYLLRSGEPTIVINLHEKYTPMILEGANLTSPYIQLGSRGTADLGKVLVPSLTTLYYVQNAQRNLGFMKHDRLTHVWLNHGDSDKPANFNDRHALYDVLVVCGQAGIDRYERHGIHVDANKFRVLGRPQASDVAPARGPIAELTPQVVLYAPTWQGLDAAVNFSSLERGPEIVRELLARGATVIFRPHPLSYRWKIRRAVVREIHALLKQDKIDTGRKHVWGKKADKVWSVADCANAADALISDVSSVVSDFLQSEKPYAMTSMHGSIEEFRSEFSVAETAYVILGDLSNLTEVLDQLLGSDPLAEARRQLKQYVLGDFTGEESAEAFAEFVRDTARGPT